MKPQNLLPLGLLLCSFLFPAPLFASGNADISGTVYQDYPIGRPNQAVEVFIMLDWNPTPFKYSQTAYTDINGRFSTTFCCYLSDETTLWTVVCYDSCAQKNDTIQFTGEIQTGPINFFPCETSVTAGMYTPPIGMYLHPPLYFHNNSVGKDLNYVLDFGDGGIFTSDEYFLSVQHIYPPGNYQACLQVNNAFGQDTFCLVQSIPNQNLWHTNASFFYAYPETRATDCSIDFFYGQYFQLAGNSVKYKIDYGDGTSDSVLYQPVGNGSIPAIHSFFNHTYSISSYTARITRTIYSGTTVACTNWLSFNYTALPPTVSDFSYTNNKNVLTFLNHYSDTNIYYLWYFGDGTNANTHNPVHTFAPGTYEVCLTAYNGSGCYFENCDSITVYKPAAASFSYTVGRRMDFTFYNTSTGGDASNPLTYLWDFGDGTTSTSDASAVTHRMKTGTHHVCLTATGGGANNEDTYCQKVFYKATQAVTPGTLGLSNLWKSSQEPEAILQTEIAVFPNPFRDNLQIELQSPDAIQYELTISNVTGQVVYSESQSVSAGSSFSKVDLSRYERGIYFVEVKLAEKLEVFKVWKE